ncbi:MAG: ATP-binding protein [Methanobrevibacter sp.]|jgi:Cdc6-like AAA superfamily ATPase|nr:ATP-binding protein [Candidatus Methanovirga meridionalis]
MLKESPFQPGYPVDPEKFKGRKKITEQVDRYLPKILKGEAQHFFITGERGMGKTSLATYINSFVKRKYKLIGVHVLNDGVHDVNSLIKQIIERLLNEIETETWSEAIIKKFKKYIKSVDVFGTKIKFQPDKEISEYLKDNFPLF